MLKSLMTKIAIICLCFVSTNSFAALQGDTAWEVRPTNGNDNNGGCYDTGGSGTDYSQQDAAQLSLTDLATSGAGVTTLTSATGGFTSAMVDNCIQIRSGTNVTAGFYEITVHTDTNTVTLDRAPDDGVGGISSGVGDVGGALLTANKAEDNLIAGNTVWIKNETWNEQFTVDGVSGTQTNPIIFEGYNATRNDDPTGANRPRNNRGDAAGDAITVSQDKIIFRNLWVSNNAGHAWTGGLGNPVDGGRYIQMENCRASNNGDDGIEFNAGTSGYILFFYNSESDNNLGGGIDLNNNNMAMDSYNSYFHDNSGIGATVFFTSGHFHGNIFDSNSNVGLDEISNGTVINNIAYNNSGASSDGFDLSGAGDQWAVYNNISIDNGRYGFTSTGASPYMFFDNNIYSGNGTAGVNNISVDHNNLTDDPSFTDDAGGDFTLSSGSNAIASGLDVGDFTNVVGDYKVNIGVDQDDHTTGGGGASAHTFVGGF